MSMSPVRLAQDPLSSLPAEILVRIMLFCSFLECNQLAFVSRQTYQAYKVAPVFNGRRILHHVYNGDLECVFRPMIFDSSFLSDLIDDLRESINSKWVEYQRDVLERDPAFCGKYAIVVAIIGDLTLQETTPDHMNQDMYTLTLKAQDCIARDSLGAWCPWLMDASIDLFDMVTPTLDDLQRFQYAMSHFAYYAGYCLLERIFDHLDYYDSNKVYTHVTNILYKDPDALFTLLFNCRYTMNHGDLYDFYYDTCFHSDRSKISVALLDALLNKHLDLNLWFHQLACWMYLTRSTWAVKTLLSHPAVDPGRWDNLPLRISLQNGHYQSANILVQSPRVNPSSLMYELSKQDSFFPVKLTDQAIANPNFRYDYDDILLLEAFVGSSSLARVLINDPRVDLGADQNRLLLCAIKKHAVRVVPLLLKDNRVDPADRDHEIFFQAIRIASPLVANAFFQDDRINVSAHGTKALQLAIDTGYSRQVKAILNHPRFKFKRRSRFQYPSNWIQYALERENVNIGLLDVLLNDKRIDPSLNRNEALYFALSEIYPDEDFEDVRQGLSFFETSTYDMGDPFVCFVLEALKDDRVLKKLN